MEIKIEDLYKVFSARKKTDKDTIAVNNMNLVIPSGKLVGLLGPSGCGKSTTLYLLSGLETPTKGNIYFGDLNVTKLPPEKRGIGLVFQNYALYPHMTVEQNIMFPLTNQKVDKETMKAKVYEAAELVQIEQLLNRRPGELSGGQQQRVAIARALVKTPNLLLLDEPLSNLDARLRLQTREEIKRIQKETGVTTIFVTHDQEEAMSICDIMIVMKDGVVMQVGEPQSLYDNPCNLFVAQFLGTPQINTFKARIESNKLYIGDDELFDINLEDQELYCAIRPEGFIYSDNGLLNLSLDHIEVLGRDKSIIAKSAHSVNEKIRIIINSDVSMNVSDNVSFNINPSKLYLFDLDGKRIKI